MFNNKSLKVNFLLTLLLALQLFPTVNYAQAVNNSEEQQQRFDYRRQDLNNLPPVEKYAQPKEQVFPLGYGTNHLGKITTGTGVWTELNPLVPRVTYIGLHFVNKDTGWACGQSGAVIKTINGGDDWRISETPINNFLLKTHSYNGQVVMVTGYDGIILRSSDEGETFIQVPSGVGNGYDLWGVQMLNDTLGWVCGLNQTLLKTTDAGLTWQPVSAGLNQHYWSLDFIDEQYGMIACSGGKILKTTDGGNNWLQIQAGDTRALYTIDVIDSLHIAAAGANGKNVYSSDGGAIWISNQDIPAFTSTNWIEFIDADTGYSVQDVYDIRKTTNRGQTWFNPGGGGEWQIQLLEDGTGYSGGEGLNIFKRTNGLDNWSKLFLNENWNDVLFINEMKGYFIGGGLYKTENGGISYQKIENSPGGNVLSFVNSDVGFIGYSSYTRIYKTSDAGITWSLANISGLTDTIGRINKIFFISSTSGWSVAAGILNTTDYGNNWFAQLNAPYAGFTSIYLVDSLYGWATVVGRRPYKTTNGGLDWIEQTSLNIWDSRDIFFRDYQNGCLIGFNELYNTTDSGTAWILNPNITGFNIAELSTFQDSTIFIIGDKTFRSLDGGESWFEFTELSGITLTGMNLLNSGFGFAVGSGGLILKYYDTTYVPVELISFRGELIKDEIVLTWITASELNNQGFYIEKSFDKKNFETIGFIKGKGNSTETSLYSFVDHILTDLIMYYRLKQVDYNGSFTYSEIIEIEIPVNNFSLSQNFPNPANPSTNISFSVPEKTKVMLKLYSISGEVVKDLIDEEKDRGIYSISLDLNDLATGVYFYRMTTSKGYSNVRKLILLK